MYALNRWVLESLGGFRAKVRGLAGLRLDSFMVQASGFIGSWIKG